MEDKHRDKFLSFFAELAARYPNATIRAEHGVAYWNALSKYSMLAVIGAFERAYKESPVYFPTCSTVNNHAKILNEQEVYQIPQTRKLLPSPISNKLDKDNPYEKLALRWIEESRLGGWVGSCPQEVGLRRMRELQEVMSSNPIGVAL